MLLVALEADAKCRELGSIMRPLFDDELPELLVKRNGDPDDIDDVDELRAR